MQQNPDPSGGVTFEEQSLRDGLQNEDRLFSLHEKVEIVRLLAEAGVRRLQIGSFVDPRRVPQMRQTEELAERVHGEWPHLLCSALVLNEQGLDRAVRCGMRHLSLSVSVSDTHSRRNAGCAAEAALDKMAVLVRKAVELGIRVRAGVQCAFGCVDEGQVPEEAVLATVQRWWQPEQRRSIWRIPPVWPIRFRSGTWWQGFGLRCRKRCSLSTCTMPGAWVWLTCLRDTRPGCGYSMCASAGWAAAPLSRGGRQCCR